MVDIHIVFDSGPIVGLVDLIIVAFTVIVALQVINNFIGLHTPIFARKEDKKLIIKINSSQPKPNEAKKIKKKSTKFDKVPKVIKDNLVDEKYRRKRFGLF
jgi:hypothetical protein